MPRPRSRAEIQREYRRRRDADPERRENYLPYPGRILSVDENDVEVDCMHSVPNRFELASNVFYWPKPIKDICFYSFENVVAVIPEPRQVSERGRASSHFCVDASIWEEIKQRFQ